MWGSRARIGQINGTTVETPLTEFFRIAPEGVTLAITSLAVRLSAKDADRPVDSVAQLEQGVRLLAEREVDCILAPSSPISREVGVGADAEFARRMREATGIPLTTSNMAMVDALRALEVSRLAVLTPFTAERVTEVRDYLAGTGIEVVGTAAMGLSPDELWCTAPARTYRALKDLLREQPQAQALYVDSAELSVPDIAAIEFELGVPVVTQTHALIWAGCFIAHVRDESFATEGRLFHTLVP